MEIAPVISFTNGGNTERGRLSWEDGVFKFEGDADESAKIFIDSLQGYFDGEIKIAVAAELERRTCAECGNLGCPIYKYYVENANLPEHFRRKNFSCSFWKAKD